MIRSDWSGSAPDAPAALDSVALDSAASAPEATHSDWQLDAYDYHLPEARIAQNPVVPRDSSRLLIVEADAHQHYHFRDLDSLLLPGDLLVMNNTRVMPARLHGRKLVSQSHSSVSNPASSSASSSASHSTNSGSAEQDSQPSNLPVEVLLLEEQSPDHWLALVKPGRRLKPGAEIGFGWDTSAALDGQPLLTAVVQSVDAATGGRLLQFRSGTDEPVVSLLAQLGEVPLPPYITDSEASPDQYQTVYAEHSGSAAAPTAGLHFTPELLERLAQTGIEQTFVTLHVGVGTFRPVEATDITTHQMHGEWVEVSPETVAKIAETKARGGRVIAVGTTSVRSLEGASQTGALQPFCGKTNLYIYPGYHWQVVDGLITNFHLPKSSLMMLVSSLIGRQRVLDLYQTAIEAEYRFYSFGDAMLILPEAVLPEVRAGSSAEGSAIRL
ncbi:MAG: tRNA preQ1(34) S-adenosylmethionine ribosyltransferase-isomerase QueA [Elainella sp.]